MNITGDQEERAREVHAALESEGLKARLDIRNEKIGKKIRETTLERIPYMLVLGAREVEDGTVSVRERSAGDLGSSSLEGFVERAVLEIRERR